MSSKVRLYYNWVIWYKIDLILCFDPRQLDAIEAMRHCLNKNKCVWTKCYSLGIMLNVITNSRIHQNLLKYWFKLRHFAMDDPVVVLEKKKKKRSKPSDKPGRFLLHDFFQRKVNFPSLCDALRFSFLAVVSTVNDFLFFRNSDGNFHWDSSKVLAKFYCHLHL